MLRTIRRIDYLTAHITLKTGNTAPTGSLSTRGIKTFIPKLICCLIPYLSLLCIQLARDSDWR